MDALSDKKIEFDKALEVLRAELQKLRTGRANPLMIEDIKADYYGTKTPLRQLASISVPEPRQLLVAPWDKASLAPIEKAIRDSGLGLNPTNEGDKIRVAVPELTEERRRELLKVAGRIAEEGRIRIRAIREEIAKEIKKQEDSGLISEDERFRLGERLQKEVDDCNAQIKNIFDIKQKEIMTV